MSPTGRVAIIVKEFIEGLKAAFGYAGASSIEEMWGRAKLGGDNPLRN